MGNTPVTGGSPHKSPVMQSFDVSTGDSMD